jgi:hypothetical protein
MSSEREKCALMTEGTILRLCGDYPKSSVIVHARSVADGAYNAIVRMDGPEAASRMAFALADRISAGLIDGQAGITVADLLPAPQPAPDPRPERITHGHLATVMLAGIVAGFLIATGMHA